MAYLDSLSTWQDPLAIALQQLAKMGFDDQHQNTELLRRHSCNVNLVVDELLSTAPSTDHQMAQVIGLDTLFWILRNGL